MREETRPMACRCREGMDLTAHAMPASTQSGSSNPSLPHAQATTTRDLRARCGSQAEVTARFWLDPRVCTCKIGGSQRQLRQRGLDIDAIPPVRWTGRVMPLTWSTDARRPSSRRRLTRTQALWARRDGKKKVPGLSGYFADDPQNADLLLLARRWRYISTKGGPAGVRAGGPYVTTDLPRADLSAHQIDICLPVFAFLPTLYACAANSKSMV